MTYAPLTNSAGVPLVRLVRPLVGPNTYAEWVHSSIDVALERLNASDGSLSECNPDPFTCPGSCSRAICEEMYLTYILILVQCNSAENPQCCLSATLAWRAFVAGGC